MSLLDYKKFLFEVGEADRLLQVSVDKKNVGAIKSTDSESFDKISRIAQSASGKDEIYAFLKSVGIPDRHTPAIFDLLSHGDMKKVSDYFADRTLDISSAVGTEIDAASFCADKLGLAAKDSYELLEYNWSSQPVMGKGELWLTLMLKDGNKPSKGDVMAGGSTVEVKGKGARIMGQSGYGDAKNMPNAFVAAINNVVNALELENFSVFNGNGNEWNITKEQGRLVEENLMQLAKAYKKRFGKEELQVISAELVNAYKTYLLNLDEKLYSGALADCIKPDGKIDVVSYNKTLFKIYFDYYHKEDGFQYFALHNSSTMKVMILNPSEVPGYVDSGKIMIDSTPAFGGSSGSQGGTFAITLK